MMKIVFPYNTFAGGFLKSIMKSFEDVGHKTYMLKRFESPFKNKLLRFSKIQPFVESGILMRDKLYNNDILRQMEESKPDVFINKSGSNFFPETLKTIKEKYNCLMICYIADNPCDPDPRRDQYFPMTLQYYDIFLNPEPVWDKIINNLCKKPKIIRFLGGYDPNNFYPIKDIDITSEDRAELECEVSFTGGSYKKSAEGAYRSGIINNLNEYNVKIWGDSGWKYRFQYMPKIKESYHGERLSYDKLRKLYKLSKINLNIPSPQIFTSFQPRVFDIASSKGFQIIDHSDELYKIFSKDLVVTFKSINDLKDKIQYFLKNYYERIEIANDMYEIVKDNYTWTKAVNEILKEIELI